MRSDVRYRARVRSFSRRNRIAAMGVRIDDRHRHSSRAFSPRMFPRASSVASHPTFTEGCDSGQRCKVPVAVKDGKIVPHGTSSNQTVDARSDGKPCPPRVTVQRDRFFENFLHERRFHDWESEHSVAREAEGAVVSKTLQHLLNHGKACHDFVELELRFQVEAARSGKNLDPHRRVN